MNIFEKEPPNNLEAERLVIGSMLLGNKDSIVTSLSMLKPDDFYSPTHEQIFMAIKTLFTKNYSINLVSVFEYLQKKDILEEIGGYGYLSDLCGFGSIAAIESNCFIVLSNAQRRALFRSCIEIAQACFNEPEISVLIDDSEKKILEIGKNRFIKGIEHIKETVLEFQKNTKSRKNDINFIDNNIVKTNIKTLDSMMKPTRSDLIVIAGRPAMGKSSLLLEIARNICVIDKKPVVLFTPEMTKYQVIKRLISLNSDISSYKMAEGFLNSTEWETFDNTIELLSSENIPFFIDDTTNLTISEMRAKLRKLTQKYGEIGAVITDYLGMIKFEGNQAKTKADQISETALGCKNLAKEFNTVHYLGCQLSREVEKVQSKRPSLSHLKESGGIEENANKVILLYRDQYYNKDTKDIGIAELDLAKHREGPTTISKMFFNADLTKFQDLEFI